MIQDDINYFILGIKEKECERIAKDLHDESLQNLSWLIHKIELASLFIEKDPVRAKLELATVEKGMRQIIDEMRKTVFNLHPVSLQDLGFKVTLERIIDTTNQDRKFSIEKDIEDVSCENKLILLSILRLTAECCNNAVKHSNGNKILVSLKSHNNKIILKISDNGKGFDVADVDSQNNHFGILFMKERVFLMNGKMNIDSSEKGTSIKIEIPV